jgi:hypothetical protein
MVANYSYYCGGLSVDQALLPLKIIDRFSGETNHSAPDATPAIRIYCQLAPATFAFRMPDPTPILLFLFPQFIF